MTTSRERVIRSLCHEPVDRAPRDLWLAPGVQQARAEDVAEIRYRFPPDVERAELGPSSDGRAATLPGAPLADATQIASYRPPLEQLDAGRVAEVNRSCATSSRFMLAWSQTRPLARVLELLAPEAAWSRLAQGSAPVRDLIARLHEYSCREMELWARSDVDGVVLGDDWGLEIGPPRPAEMWRELFQPLVRDYCRILRAADKFVFFHGNESLAEVLPDLVQAGVDAVGCPLGPHAERLAGEFRGRVTFWGALGAQDLRDRAEAARAAVTRVRSALDFGRGGVIAECRWEPDVPLKNVAAAFEQWARPLAMHVRSAG